MLPLRNRLKQCVSALGIAASLMFTAQAHADRTAEAEAGADALFREARALMEQQRYTEACPKFAASQELDPASGTLLNLGDCYEHTGKTASAWASFNQAEVMARKANDKLRVEEATRRANVLEPKLSRIRIDVAVEEPAAGIEVRHDGKVLAPELWGHGIPVDPGAHTVEATRPGRLPWRATIRVEDNPGETAVQVPPLSPASGAAGIHPDVANGPLASGWSTQRTVGVVVMGVGVTGVAIGAIFGVKTLGKSSDSEPHCSAGFERCDPTGIDLQREAHSAATVSNVAFALGGAALIGGVVLFLTTPSAGDAPPTRVALRLEGGRAQGAPTARLSIRREW